MQKIDLNKPYNPQDVETNIYKMWEDSGYFNPDNLPKGNVKVDEAGQEETYTIVMPPPNANGSLHAGHALFATIQDILIRYHRMQGKRALWIPGADHAGFETQVVYEKVLEKQGRSRFDMSREDLYKEIMDFTLSNKAFMEGQLRQMGASCDWSRSLFTLDDKVIKTVYNTFKKLEDDGLLYRGKRIVNWCPKHQTSLSNLETLHITRKDPFHYFKYGPFTIGTVRPETKFGDKYVVMHPDDTRYKEYTHGQKINVEWINGNIEATIIKDNSIDMEFGTGVMTITPWHSGVDFDIAQKYNLDYEQIIDERGKLLSIAGEFAGMNIKDVRAKVVEKLKEKNLIVKIDDNYEHEVSVCYKCEREIEPQVKDQWFMKMKDLADRALESLDKKEINILSEQHDKVFRHWMSNVQDWNISRQIAWGIPIPAKICTVCESGYVDINDTIKSCKSCGADKDKLVKDTDTFDTWFSSGQWPLLTTGYPDSPNFKKYYPTQVMETGSDLIFFWVARMVMFGLYMTDKVPFKDVYMHGMVRDAKGKKMSKSKGNVISPLEISDKYGTDALRMSLIVNNAPGVDMNLDPKKVEAYKKFANKIWNATRFVLEKAEDLPPAFLENNLEAKENIKSTISSLNKDDKDLLENWYTIKKDIIGDIENYRLHIASEKIYDYFWKTFCDVIIETHKLRIQNAQDYEYFCKTFCDMSIETRKLRIQNAPDTSAEARLAMLEDKKSAQILLRILLREQMIILHPFMPFITEALWDKVKFVDDSDMLMIQQL